jgi:enamine deaminase RidA (YjgF/YER057c/UK114 family)
MVQQLQVQRLTVSDLFPPPGYAHAAVARGAQLVVTAGAVPLDDAGALVGADDYRAQARQTIANLLRQLQAAGASGDDVLKTTVYVVANDGGDLLAVWEAVQESPLGYPGQLVEIEAIAALP